MQYSVSLQITDKDSRNYFARWKSGEWFFGRWFKQKGHKSSHVLQRTTPTSDKIEVFADYFDTTGSKWNKPVSYAIFIT